ncbi:MAG TPA: class I SAM-dependent methyltransferase [Polyangiaceae bacterium]|jgi:SAM-dependent methyltransferase|nr:class I SAM-dependent methyltransferase [Polyangiaceae bacterium]
MPKKTTKKKKKMSKFSAKTADKHDLYQRSVQDADSEVYFITRAYKTTHKDPPLSLREDFCGTALLCAGWVKSSKQRSAVGIDIDPKVLAWGKAKNLAPLGEDANRIKLLQQDVRKPSAGKHDVVCAFNFSYWIFKTRDEMRSYFASVKKGLKRGGMFMIDAYGGWESHETMLEPRQIKGGFVYVWDQAQFNPITHDVLNHIHFEFADGTKMQKAFSYVWRYWTLPELTELLTEAGYANVRVFWDKSKDDDYDDYRPTTRAENQPGWLAYIVASA